MKLCRYAKEDELDGRCCGNNSESEVCTRYRTGCVYGGHRIGTYRIWYFVFYLFVAEKVLSVVVSCILERR